MEPDEPPAEPVDVPVDTPVDEPVEEPVEEPVDEPVDEPAEEPADERRVESPSAPARADGSFATTRWSVVRAAARADAPAARAALATLCETYWFPVYAFVRRRGHDADTAAELTQGFFTRLLERRDLALADPARGRFRAFLLTAVKSFVANERARARAEKRGGGVAPLSLGAPAAGRTDFDAGRAEARYRLEPADGAAGPEAHFERAWALTVLDRALETVAAEYAARGRERLFATLRPVLVHDAERAPYAELARELATTEGAVKVAVHRLRKRFGEALRAEVAGTLADPADLEDELRALLAALGSA